MLRNSFGCGFSPAATVRAIGSGGAGQEMAAGDSGEAEAPDAPGPVDWAIDGAGEALDVELHPATTRTEARMRADRRLKRSLISFPSRKCGVSGTPYAVQARVSASARVARRRPSIVGPDEFGGPWPSDIQTRSTAGGPRAEDRALHPHVARWGRR